MAKGYSNIRVDPGVNIGRVNPRLLQVMNQLARARGEVVTINSGYRSPAHSVQVGGFANDPHTRGIAVDAYINGRPIGAVIPPSVWSRYGVESGDVPGFYNGKPDPEHLQLGGGSYKGGGGGLSGEAALIARLARQYNVDPNAALAIASVEGGFGGAVGDHGTSFGPFQLHEGGALPSGRGSAWANSPAGIRYAMQRIASVAGGLHGRQAVAAISSRFERPANVPAEIAKAMSRYGNVAGGGGFPSQGGAVGLPNAGASSGMDPSTILSLVQTVLANNAAKKSAGPTINPIPVQYSLGGS